MRFESAAPSRNEAQQDVGQQWLLVRHAAHKVVLGLRPPRQARLLELVLQEVPNVGLRLAMRPSVHLAEHDGPPLAG
jgi:hypothetical protein